MNTKNEILQRCVTETFTGKMPFPTVIQEMTAVGVRWYSANLYLGAKTHYFADGEVFQVKWPEWTPLTICPPFDVGAVVGAIRASQHGEIIYPEFLARIKVAGVAFYTVHLQGRKAVYFGADGDFHVELFPTTN